MDYGLWIMDYGLWIMEKYRFAEMFVVVSGGRTGQA